MPSIDDIYGVAAPAAPAHWPEVVSSPPTVITPNPGQALVRFLADPAGLKASALTVLDAKVRPVETQQAATDLAERLSQVRTLVKNIEARRKQHVEPLKKEAKAIDEEARRWREPLERYEVDATRALGAFMRLDEDRKRREEEARQSALRDAAQKQLQAEAMENAPAIEAASVAIARLETEAPAEAVKGFKTDAGSVTSRKVWRVEVVKVEDLPLSYLMPDLAKLRAAVASGVREVPGCSIFEDTDVTIRTR